MNQWFKVRSVEIKPESFDVLKFNGLHLETILRKEQCLSIDAS